MAVVSCIHINEDETYVLNEDGGYNVLEACADAIVEEPTGTGGYAAQRPRRAARLLQIEREDEELMVLT